MKQKTEELKAFRFLLYLSIYGAIPVFAIGAGSSRFAGRADNTDIPKRIVSAMGIEW